MIAEEDFYRESTNSTNGQMRFSRYSALSSSPVAEAREVEAGMKQESFNIDPFLFSQCMHPRKGCCLKQGLRGLACKAGTGSLVCQMQHCEMKTFNIEEEEDQISL